jgi:methylated-DNA-[protein]-cysteine S-methyltransferase
MNYQYLDSPIGTLRLISNGEGLARIEFDGQHNNRAGESQHWDSVLTACAEQLTAYFSRECREFDLPLAPTGTPFQKEVWRALKEIPYGELRSYSDIAKRIDRASAVRAVGAANGRNPLPIVVPCHRVIGSNGKLTGFAGGLDVKEQLLELEGALPQSLGI